MPGSSNCKVRPGSGNGEGVKESFFIPLSPLAGSREITANTISTWVKNVVRAYETIAGEDLQVSGTMAHESRSMAAS